VTEAGYGSPYLASRAGRFDGERRRLLGRDDHGRTHGLVLGYGAIRTDRIEEGLRMPALVENAASTEARPNAAAPAHRSRRRPIRLPRVRIVISEPATRKP
jgi:hypothetical protein